MRTIAGSITEPIGRNEVSAVNITQAPATTTAIGASASIATPENPAPRAPIARATAGTCAGGYLSASPAVHDDSAR